MRKPGYVMSFERRTHAAPTTPGMDHFTGQLPSLPARAEHGSRQPRFLRMPADWWHAPPAAGSLLSPDPGSAATARRLTRDALRDWELSPLAADAEIIIGELVANAVTHGAWPRYGCQPDAEGLSFRLRRRKGDLICAVLDPSDAAPVLKSPHSAADSGRGLQLVDALSDVWGWSPVAGHGKAVWAVLFLP